MDGDIERTAKWSHLVELHQLEAVTPLVKMSALDEVAVSPKPIERQRVSTVLKVFNERNTNHSCTILVWRNSTVLLTLHYLLIRS